MHSCSLFFLFNRNGIFLFFLAALCGLGESQFPDLGLNLGHGSESTES